MNKLTKPQLSIVIPVYNEDTIIQIFHQRLSQVLEPLSLSTEILYVNDGSEDNSLSVLQDLQKSDPRIALLDLTRNFGKEVTLSAGLDHCQGDAVVIIDADLQHPPELIPTLIERWQQGFDIVCAKRSSRPGESSIKKYLTRSFYWILQKLSDIEIPLDIGDFRLINRRTVEAIKKLPERRRFMKGLFAWVGFKTTFVTYEQEIRIKGESKFNYSRLIDLAIEGITSFSIIPLKFATYFGFLTALCAFSYALVIIYKTLAYGESVHGYPSLMVVILFLGSIQLITLGIIGEYLGRIFVETKQRPLYIVNSYAPGSF